MQTRWCAINLSAQCPEGLTGRQALAPPVGRRANSIDEFRLFVAVHFDAQVDTGSRIRAAAAVEFAAAKVPAVAAVKSLPDCLYG